MEREKHEEQGLNSGDDPRLVAMGNRGGRRKAKRRQHGYLRAGRPIQSSSATFSGSRPEICRCEWLSTLYWHQFSEKSETCFSLNAKEERKVKKEWASEPLCETCAFVSLHNEGPPTPQVEQAAGTKSA